MVELIVGIINILSLKEVVGYGSTPVAYDSSAIVNAANKYLAHNGGLAWHISMFAGGSFQDDSFLLVKDKPLHIGEAIEQDGGPFEEQKYANMPSRYVIHAVGPDWDEINDPVENERLLRSAYTKALEKAEELKLEDIALPGLSIGIFHFPQDKAARIVQEVIDGFKYNHIQRVILCYREDTLPAFLKNTRYIEGKQTI